MEQGNLCLKCILLIYFTFNGCFSDEPRGLEVIPERAEITYTNSKYIYNNTVNVRRYKRRGDYVINVWGYNKHIWDNNITIDIVFYEYLHNEYKRSFVEMHFKLCDLINKDKFIGSRLREKGVTCPFKIGYNGIKNATLSFPTFPYVFPFEKCKAEITFKVEPSHEVIGSGVLYLVAKQIPLKYHR